MKLTRIGFHHRVFAAGLTLLMALSFTACVSVKESGTKVSSPPAPTASVAFRSVPEDAEVFVDGQFRGTTPLNLHLAAGTHKVDVKLAGYQAFERELLVVAGNDTRVSATLERE